MLSIWPHLGIKPLKKSLHLNSVILRIQRFRWWSSFLWFHKFALGIHLGLVSLVIQGAEDQDVEGAANVFSAKVLDHWSVGADAFEAIALSSQGLVI